MKSLHTAKSLEGDWPEAWPKVGFVDELHIFDANGDVLLQLQKMTAVEIDETTPEIDDSTRQKAIDKELATPKEILSLNPVTDEKLLEPLSTSHIPDKPLDSRATMSGPEEDLAHDSAATVYLRVSSKHLILASAMFNTMLTPDKFLEGRTLRSEGNLLINLSDDPEILMVLMGIIHGKTRRVARRFPLEKLVQLAHLVNYYQLHEAVELFSDTWVTTLRPEYTLKCYDDPNVILMWLFISWVFHREDDFKTATLILISESDGRLQDSVDNQRIPIPASIIQRIQESRIAAIRHILTVIQGYIADYSTTAILCTERALFCDARLLGSLVKGSTIIGIVPPPKRPYYGLTFKSLAHGIRKMQILDTCTHNNRYGARHGLQLSIYETIKSLEDQLCGLELNSFLLEGQMGKEQLKKGKEHR